MASALRQEEVLRVVVPTLQRAAPLGAALGIRRPTTSPNRGLSSKPGRNRKPDRSSKRVRNSKPGRSNKPDPNSSLGSSSSPVLRADTLAVANVPAANPIRNLYPRRPVYLAGRLRVNPLN